MGVVYAAEDAARGEVVALKTLPEHLVADDVRRLKQEFRVLADIVHPNLIKIHELHVDAQECFFTMDLLDGVDFVEHVRDVPSSAGHSLIREKSPLEGAPFGFGARNPPPRRHFKEHALRDALLQLIEGVNAMHGYGLLHRDLKPSNVMVTTDDRVVILDFGLAQVESYVAARHSALSGTPSYMSPEQARGERATAASDWYSVGAMLYETLTGQPPLADRAGSGSLLIRKQIEDVPAPSTRADVPDDLDQLCVRLLRRDPKLRPDGNDVLMFLGGRGSVPSVRTHSRARAQQFFGRATELEQLERAFQESRQRMSVVCVEGNAGIGKSALVAEYLHRCRDRHNGLVLTSRCHEREHIPYKAFDGIADGLASYLENLADGDADELLSKDWACLVLLFPVLGSLRDVAAPFELDPFELRRLAFSALIELLRNLSKNRSIVLHVDDVQWLDQDSLLLFQHLLTSEDAPPLLLVLSSRSEGEPSPLVEELLRTAASEDEVELARVVVEPLSYDDSLALAQSVLVDRPDSVANRIALEAKGSPFFVWQMAHHASELGTLEGIETTLAITSVIHARFSMLPLEAQTLLEFVALAGRPARVSVLGDVIKPANAEGTLDLLQRLQLTKRLPDGDRVAAFHDTIRETISSRIDASKGKELHFRLARALEVAEDTDFEELSRHYELGGDVVNARRWLLRAAERAAETLAFSQAARLYERALAQHSRYDSEYPSLQLLWADALIRDQRGAEASVPLLDVANQSERAEALKLKLRAAEQLLTAGNLGTGLEVVSEVLQAVGDKLPGSANMAWAEAALAQTRLRWHSLRFREKSEAELPSEELLKLDAYKAIALALSMVDLARSAALEARYTLAALRLGEPKRVAIGLSTHATFISTAGVKTKPRTLALLAKADQIVAENPDESVAAYVNICRGLCQTHFSDWRNIDQLYEAVEQVYREQFNDQTFSMMFSRAMWARSLAELGQWKRQSQLLRAWLGPASEQGNRYLAANLRVFYGHCHWLRTDDADQAASQVAEAAALWPTGEFNAQRLSADAARAQIALYTGHADSALGIMQALDRQTRSSMLRFHQVSRIMIHYTLGCSALAVAQRGDRSGLELAMKQAKQLTRIDVPYTRGAARLLMAGVHHLEGRDEPARQALNSAVEDLELAGRAMHRATALWQLAKLSSGAEAERLRQTAEEFFAAQEVARHDRVARMLAPGFE